MPPVIRSCGLGGQSVTALRLRRGSARSEGLRRTAGRRLTSDSPERGSARACTPFGTGNTGGEGGEGWLGHDCSKARCRFSSPAGFGGALPCRARRCLLAALRRPSASAAVERRRARLPARPLARLHLPGRLDPVAVHARRRRSTRCRTMAAGTISAISSASSSSASAPARATSSIATASCGCDDAPLRPHPAPLARPRAASPRRRCRKHALARAAARPSRVAGFRRQVPFGPYLVDFAQLAGQADHRGRRRRHGDAAGWDADRTRFLATQGYWVLRVRNDEVLRGSRRRARGHRRESPLPSPSRRCRRSAGPSTLPAGEGFMEN